MVCVLIAALHVPCPSVYIEIKVPVAETPHGDA